MNCNYNVDLVPDISELAELKPGACPVDWALRCVETARINNCGKSVMCRDGLTQLQAILRDLTHGKSEEGDVELIEDLCGVIAGTGGCGLSAKAAENVLYSVRTYREEWELHLRKHCTALVCKSYCHIVCLPDKCVGSGKCIAVCPEKAIAGGNGLISVIDDSKCTRCGKCLGACPSGAIIKAETISPRFPTAPVPVGSYSAEGGRRRRRRV